MDIAYDLTLLAAAKLIVYTLGSLVHLFLMVVILGQRRLRRLEWLLFALISALFMWNSGNLLALNVALAYGPGKKLLWDAARLIPFLGLVASAPLLVHLHAEYFSQFHRRTFAEALVVVSYLPLAAVPWAVRRLLVQPATADPLVSLRPFLVPLALWLGSALVIGAVFDLLARVYVRGDPRLSRFLASLAALQLFLAVSGVGFYVLRSDRVFAPTGYYPTFLALVAVLPGVLVGYSIFRYNFLELQVQRNLIYSVVAIFALLLYIDFIRHLSGYLDERNLVPAVITESVLIFCMVVFLEPVRKAIDRMLERAFASEFGRVQRLSIEIQAFAKQAGDLNALVKFVEEKVPAELGLESVKLSLGRIRLKAGDSALPSKVRVLAIRRGGDVIGYLDVVPVTSVLSGEMRAGLELLADQLAAAIELCQLIAEKVKLERQLAEKAKMAFLGEMAARIAHNVKNPLSSMKTIVQLMEEDSSVPERARQDCRLVIDEIDRLNSNISQVLRYAKPARDTDRPADLIAVVKRVLDLTRPEAERRQVHLELEAAPQTCLVIGGEEAVSDMVSNLLVNALEASSPGGRVVVRAATAHCSIGQTGLSVEDDGPGISQELQAKIFQPFFTTRSGGTGLGLAIVARRAEEIGGSVVCVSPIHEGKGTRFSVRFQTAS